MIWLENLNIWCITHRYWRLSRILVFIMRKKFYTRNDVSRLVGTLDDNQLVAIAGFIVKAIDKSICDRLPTKDQISVLERIRGRLEQFQSAHVIMSALDEYMPIVRLGNAYLFTDLING